jgi:threonine synthase
MVEDLKCRECGKTYSAQPVSMCEECFGPLEFNVDYSQLEGKLTRDRIAQRPNSMWRYRELLPSTDIPPSGAFVGFTPLIHANNLAKHWGLQNLYIKNDAVNFPSLSFKDRVVSVALAKAIDFGFKVVGCASTGNLANAVAAQAAASKLQTCILIPADLEPAKITGTLVYGANLIAVNGNYDEVNRLCTQIAERYQWGFVNVNLRPYYAEGSKTYGFEILEQLGWNTPQHIIVPMAGGSLITKIHKAIQEFQKLGLVEQTPCRIYGAQAEGCAPIVNMVKQELARLRPVKPNTIAKSLAIGNPADGIYAARVMRQSGGTGESATDEEIIAGIRLLATTEGIFTETAGGVVIAAAEKLIRSGRIPPDESIVLCITGNGLKTQDAITETVKITATIKANIQDFQRVYEQGGKAWQYQS